MKIYKRTGSIQPSDIRPIIVCRFDNGSVRINHPAISFLDLQDTNQITFGYENGVAYIFKTDCDGIVVRKAKDIKDKSFRGCSKEIAGYLFKDIKMAGLNTVRFLITEESKVTDGMIGYQLMKL